MARFSRYAPSNELFGAIRHLRATILSIGAIPIQSCGGGKEIFPPSHRTRTEVLSQNGTEMLGSRWTMPASWPSSRTRWSTRVGIRRRKQGGLQGNCCRTSCAMTPRARRPSRAMAGHSPTTSRMPSWAILTNGKVTEDKVGPHGDLLTEFPYLGPPHNA
jgi:hypothetical protein